MPHPSVIYHISFYQLWILKLRCHYIPWWSLETCWQHFIPKNTKVVYLFIHIEWSELNAPTLCIDIYLGKVWKGGNRGMLQTHWGLLLIHVAPKYLFNVLFRSLDENIVSLSNNGMFVSSVKCVLKHTLWIVSEMRGQKIVQLLQSIPIQSWVSGKCLPWFLNLFYRKSTEKYFLKMQSGTICGVFCLTLLWKYQVFYASSTLSCLSHLQKGGLHFGICDLGN